MQRVGQPLWGKLSARGARGRSQPHVAEQNWRAPDPRDRTLVAERRRVGVAARRHALPCRCSADWARGWATATRGRRCYERCSTEIPKDGVTRSTLHNILEIGWCIHDISAAGIPAARARRGGGGAAKVGRPVVRVGDSGVRVRWGRRGGGGGGGPCARNAWAYSSVALSMTSVAFVFTLNEPVSTSGAFVCFARQQSAWFVSGDGIGVE